MECHEMEWDRILTGCCPECATKMNGRDFDHYECPACKSEYQYVIYHPMDAGWVQVEKPKN